MKVQQPQSAHLRGGDPFAAQVGEALRGLLASVPAITSRRFERERRVGGHFMADWHISLRHGDTPYIIIVEAKRQGALRFVRAAVGGLLDNLRSSGRSRVIPMLVSPYLPPEARALCAENNVAYLDLMGNVRLVFGEVYIERSVAEKPKSEVRALRSIFGPKAAAVLRVMLREPGRPWRVAELAEKAQVSLGHVSNVRKVLLEREWIEATKEGVVLAKPEALLEVWRENYRRPDGDHTAAYTLLHGKSFNEGLSGVLNASPDMPRAICALHSAANWQAPYGRGNMHTFYADEAGTDALKGTLGLSLVPTGANVDILTVQDTSIFIDAEESAPGVFCTGPVTTYLDLWQGNDRDREAAEYLRGKVLQWPK